MKLFVMTIWRKLETDFAFSELINQIDSEID